MAKTIPGEPSVGSMGLSFNYEVWHPSSQIMLTNVTWNNTYSNIVDYATREDLDTYLRSGETTMTQIFSRTSYARINQPIKIRLPIGDAMKYNYVRVENPVQPVPGATTPEVYYYFILDVIHRSPNSTEIIVQLDVWQTYKWRIVEYGNVFVETGHAGIANSKAFQNNGRDYLSLPEPFDHGAALQTIAVQSRDVMGPSFFNVLVVATSDLLDEQGTQEQAKPVATEGGYFNGLPTGAGVYLFSGGGSLRAWLNKVKTKPWITQSIVSVTLIPDVASWVPGFQFGPSGTPTPAPEQVPVRKAVKMYEDWRNDSLILGNIPAEYRHLKKFLTYPYMAIELTTFSGTPIIIKPEMWSDPDATIVQRVNMVPPAQRLTVHPHWYNSYRKTNPNPLNGDDGGDYIDFTTVMSGFVSVPIPNDNSNMYAAMNSAGIAYAKESADWAQQKAFANAQQGFDLANNSMQNMEAQGMVSRNLDATQTSINNRKQIEDATFNFAAGTLKGGISGAIAGPAGSALGAGMGAVDGTIGMIQAARGTGYNNEQWGARNQAALDSLNANLGASGFARDSNLSLAQFAARGDYGNAIAGIQAKVQDASKAPPTTSGQVGGDALNMVNGDMTISLRFKMIDQAHIRMIGDYWCRFGYAVQSFMKMPKELNLMTNFTYWKVTEMFIRTEGMPEPMKQAIRGIFEKGVTVYNDASKIGFIPWTDNKPKEGFSY